MKPLSLRAKQSFQSEIWNYYAQNRRSFPWREDIFDYGIFVSEVMLQQTQAGRVVDFYLRFLSKYPDFAALAKADTRELLGLWKGLGYNRRALNLRAAAHEIVEKHKSALPQTVESMDDLPGIGRATASSVLVFAKNLPIPFIETNIRRVFIHFFFTTAEEGSVEDGEIMKLVTETLEERDARDWFYALMDYGAMLKSKFGNANKKSKMYGKQAKFEGSRRQVRGWILDEVIKAPKTGLKLNNLLERGKDKFDRTQADIRNILSELEKEGFVRVKRGNVAFSKAL
jgi:A/G-specific adenine glycosylase